MMALHRKCKLCFYYLTTCNKVCSYNKTNNLQINKERGGSHVFSLNVTRSCRFHEERFILRIYLLLTMTNKGWLYTTFYPALILIFTDIRKPYDCTTSPSLSLFNVATCLQAGLLHKHGRYILYTWKCRLSYILGMTWGGDVFFFLEGIDMGPQKKGRVSIGRPRKAYPK